MRYIKYDLPKYPQSEDAWVKLSREQRPIVVYGMGNGADKLIARFDRLNIKISDFFASDGFVRGHTFHGKRVKSFSEICDTYSDFVIVLSFASNREDVISMLEGIDARYDMYVPDMPVSGEEYFDAEFYNSHYTEIAEAYGRLADDASRNAFSAVINYKLSARMSYIMDAFSTRDELYELIGGHRIEEYLDVGAYNGDTVREALHYFPDLCRITAVEPDPKNYNRLARFRDTISGVTVNTLNAAAWSHCGEGELLSGGNRNSSVGSTASHKHRDAEISLVSVDSLGVSPDYIKYDVEGAEREALIGSHDTIMRCRPALLVSLYHRSEDIFSLVNYLAAEYPFYDLYLRRLRCVPAWELDLILLEKGQNP